jgi:hypothetical protein
MHSIASICEGLKPQAFRALWVLFDSVAYFANPRISTVLLVLFFVLL